MKKYLTVVCFILLLSCEKDHDLTEIENTGYGGISCTVDGEVLRPKRGGERSNTTCRFDFDNGTNLFSVGFFNNGNNLFRSIFITATNADYLATSQQIFSLGSEADSQSFGNYIRSVNLNETLYQTNSIKIGELKILYHDKAKGITGGTFWFDAINSEGEVVQVRNGRFDLFNN